MEYHVEIKTQSGVRQLMVNSKTPDSLRAFLVKNFLTKDNLILIYKPTVKNKNVTILRKIGMMWIDNSNGITFWGTGKTNRQIEKTGKLGRSY